LVVAEEVAEAVEVEVVEAEEDGVEAEEDGLEAVAEEAVGADVMVVVVAEEAEGEVVVE